MTLTKEVLPPGPRASAPVDPAEFQRDVMWRIETVVMTSFSLGVAILTLLRWMYP